MIPVFVLTSIWVDGEQEPSSHIELFVTEQTAREKFCKWVHEECHTVHEIDWPEPEHDDHLDPQKKPLPLLWVCPDDYESRHRIELTRKTVSI